jgi:transcriptional regulator with XRE-family HTH domain
MSRACAPDVARLARRVRARRLALGLSRHYLATEADVAYSSVVSVERGLHAPSLRVLAAICRVLDLSLDELLADEAVAS